jgi:hypothetical protein
MVGQIEMLVLEHVDKAIPNMVRDIENLWGAYTSSTLIGEKDGAGPSSLHTMLDGPTEYVNARWM